MLPTDTRIVHVRHRVKFGRINYRVSNHQLTMTNAFQHVTAKSLDAKVRDNRVQELDYVSGFQLHELVRVPSARDTSRVSLNGCVEQDSSDLVKRWYSSDRVA